MAEPPEAKPRLAKYQQQALLSNIITEHADDLTRRLFRVCLRNGMRNPDFIRLRPIAMGSLIQDVEARGKVRMRFEQAITEQWAALTLVVPFDHGVPTLPSTHRAWRRVIGQVVRNVESLLPVQMPDRTRRRLVRVLRDYL